MPLLYHTSRHSTFKLHVTVVLIPEKLSMHACVHVCCFCTFMLCQRRKLNHVDLPLLMIQMSLTD